MGNVPQAGLGQAPARQAAIRAGLPISVEATTINKICASGLKTVSIGAQQIELGQETVVVAGGMESMTRAPLYLARAVNSHASAVSNWTMACSKMASATFINISMSGAAWIMPQQNTTSLAMSRMILQLCHMEELMDDAWKRG